MKRLLFLAIGILTGLTGKSQSYPKNYFSSPLDSSLVLTGTFGEIRDNHFHSGIDLSTGQQVGLDVKAAADGYVSRIKVSPDGYGNVLYITHPNGYVTVYAHLNKFRDDLQEYTHAQQLALKAFSVDLTIKKNQFKVEKGSTIALSGNSGSSLTPHLHFEIREEKSEKPVNPLLFGLPVTDNLKPVFRSIRVYPLLESGIVENADSARSYEMFLSDTLWGIAITEYIKVWGICSIGFDVYDQQQGTDAELGIYSGELYVDGMKAFEWVNDRIDFADTRYANAHADYLVRKRDGGKMERSFRLDGDRMTDIYPDTNLTGYIEFTGEESHDLKFIARDFSGNTSTVYFQLQPYTPYANKTYAVPAEGSLLLTPYKGISVHKDDLEVTVPAGAVYQNMYFTEDVIRSGQFLSDIYIIGDRYEALHNPMTIAILPKVMISDSLKAKAVVARIDFDGSLHAQGGTWNKEMLVAKPREFGRYVIALDTIPPAIKKDYYPSDLNTAYGGVVKMSIRDEFSGLRDYSATIDGQWKLMEYDTKIAIATIHLEGLTLNMQHTLEVTATDERGNLCVFRDSFWW